MEQQLNNMSLIGSALIGGATSLLGGALSLPQQNKEMNYNSKEAQKNRDFQVSEREASQQYNTEMWEKNNEYNSMSSQVNRALEAGVNPNALFGSNYSSAVSSAPTTSPQSGNAAGYSSSLASGFLSTFSQNALALAQIRKTESETNLNQQQYDWNNMSIKERYEMLVNMNNKSKAEIQKILSDIGMNDFNKDLQERTYQWLAAKSKTEIDVMKEQLNVLRNQSLDILKGIELKDSQININEKTGALLDSQKQGQDIENSIYKIKQDYCAITGIPIDAPESHVMFTLWEKGEMDRFLNKVDIASSASPDSTPWQTFSRHSKSIAAKWNLGYNAVKEFARGLFENPQLKSVFNPR